MNKMQMHSTVRRSVGMALLLVVLIMLATGGAALAQTGSRKLKIGDKVTGTLDARTFAQTYSFDAVKGDTITITATSNTRAIFLALLLTDAIGTPLQQIAEVTRPDVTIKDFKPESGTYYVTVFRATGVQNNTSSNFSLALTGTSAPATSGGNVPTSVPIQTIELAQGMTISLSWTTSDDLNLEVRDPIGGAINLNSPSASSGGKFSGNTNGVCGTATANNPTEKVDWSKGNVPQGSYEVIVYYVKSCAQAVAPNNFTISLTVDGKTSGPINGTLERDGQNFVGSFIVDAADRITVGKSGVNTASTGLDVNDFSAKIAAPTAFTGTQVNGRIDRNNAADVYSIELAQGDSFAVTMRATNGGSLDPYLVLLGPTNVIVADNDDENQSTRNSRLEQRNVAAGRYTVIATRFGLANGGTEGDYTLALTRGSGSDVVVTLPTVAAGTAVVVVPTVGAGIVPTAGGSGTLPRGNIEVLLSWDSRSDVRILIRDPRGASLYSDRTTTDIGGRLVTPLGNFKCQNTTTTPVTYAYWPTSTRITPGTYEIKIFRDNLCGEELAPNLTLKVNVNGKEVINQLTGSPADGEAYLTTFTVDANGNASAGPFGFFNNKFSTDITAAVTSAGTIEFGVPKDGEITAAVPFQLYSFKGSAGDKITITMKRNAGTVLDPYLFLMDVDGKTQLANNDDNTASSSAIGGPVSPPDSQIKSFAIPADGNYIIVATRYGADLGGTVGKYRLTLNR